VELELVLAGVVLEEPIEISGSRPLPAQAVPDRRQDAIDRKGGSPPFYLALTVCDRPRGVGLCGCSRAPAVSRDTTTPEDRGIKGRCHVAQ